ncbi:MAG: hypothetical protein V2A74_13445 [bacterium]
MPPVHVFLNILLILLPFAAAFLLSGKKTNYFLLAGAIVVALAGYFFSVRPDILVSIFPFGGALYYANMYPFAVALAIPPAIRLGKNRFHKIRIALLMAALFVVALMPYRAFTQPLAKCNPSQPDENGIVLQSSADTCAAAATATLLARYQITATEQEVVRLAHTTQGRGTHPLGLYRALRILTAGRKDLHVRIKILSTEELIRTNKPAVITVGIPKHPTTDAEREMATRFNWDPGAVHDVAFLGASKNATGKVDIGEPAFGLEQWTYDSLYTLHRGIAIYVE